ncbi:hypothetical protein BDW22DRAFT_265127 [Trametopsis cervina]|nr:hypothetical protein BDW22DRAFT_265127 [Trametopsis cervina]
MVHVASFLGAVLFAGVASALPRPDSALGQEVAVSAPNGVVLSDTSALASRSSAAASSSANSYPAQATTSSSAYGSNSYSSSAAYGNAYASSSSSSSAAAYTASYTSSASSSWQTYGSGYNSWGGSGYDDCVAQCIANFGAPPAMYTPPPSSSSGSSSDSGSSTKTHTVIVAPTQGVLRYVPPMVKAQPGDTVHYVWHANNHTVTKSSQLEVCNKTSDAPFASGTHDKDFTFDVLVNDTTPIFFYCGTPGHCEKGMWGAINANSGNGTNSSSSVSNMMGSMLSNNPDLSAMWSYTNMMGSKYNASSQVMNWGSGYDVNSVPASAQSSMMSNIMYTRTFLAMNPEALQADGSIDMSGSRAPLQFPADISGALSNNAASSTPEAASSSSAASSSAATSASASSASATPSGKTSGARGTVVSSALVGAAVLFVSFLAL